MILLECYSELLKVISMKNKYRTSFINALLKRKLFRQTEYFFTILQARLHIFSSLIFNATAVVMRDVQEGTFFQQSFVVVFALRAHRGHLNIEPFRDDTDFFFLDRGKPTQFIFFIDNVGPVKEGWDSINRKKPISTNEQHRIRKHIPLCRRLKYLQSH